MNKSRQALDDRRSAVSALLWIYRWMSPRRRRHFYLSLGLMLLGVFAELLTIGAVLPFLALISDPHGARHMPAIALAMRWLGLENQQQLIAAATAFLVMVATVGTVVRLILTWVSQKFVFRLGHEIGVEIHSRTLHQPYNYYVLNNSSEVLSGVEKVQMTIYAALLPVMTGAIAAVMALFIVALLFAINPFAAAVAAIAMGLVYVLVSFSLTRTLHRNSQLIAQLQTSRIKQVQEGLGGIRDILIDQSQTIFERTFRELDDRYRAAQTVNVFIGAAPRFIVEGAGIVMIAGLALYTSYQPGGVTQAVPVLGALALGAQRLLPLLQLAYSGWSSLMSSKHTLFDTVKLMQAPVVSSVKRDRSKPPKPFQRNIAIDKLSFCYSGGNYTLRDINLVVEKGERVGFIGETGSGKSTLLDLVMALLEPTTGSILIDGVPLSDDNRANWQAQIAHVPQSIYLADSSVAANIAFGHAEDDIDGERVRQAAQQAQIHGFIEELPEGYDTLVGERGVRLSGGQRQRIGIARALYKRSELLVFDEATSALDGATEGAVMDAIAGSGRKLTMLMIAHRLTTLADCDRIVRLDAGKIVHIGSYSSVIGARATGGN